MRDKWLIFILILFVIVGIGFCIWRFGCNELSYSESFLLSILLTILSIIGSWIISSIYSEYSFNSSLKTYALKASEKVNNLSNEIIRLAAYLQQELETNDYKSTDDALLAREIKIESAIHILNTLKSVNDKSLSDWQGVIGDEIAAQKEKQEAKEKDLREMIDRLGSLLDKKEEDDTEIASTAENENVIDEKIESISKDLRILSSQIVGMPIKRPRTNDNIEISLFNCPKCNSIIKCKQRKLKRKMGAIKCEECDTKLYFINDGGNFIIKERLPVKEIIQCSECRAENNIEMDPFPGQVYNFSCSSCGAKLSVSRRTSGINVSKNQELFEINEEFIEDVYKLLPEQPWPKGIAIEVAKNLKVDLKYVQKAINQLIKSGRCKYQIDGELFDISIIENIKRTS